jgi:hypothetical protein
MKNDIRQ